MKKIAFLFPGYGSQFVGMSKELYDSSRTIQEYFEEASNCLATNFVKLCFASSEAELQEMHNAYAALFTVSCAVAQALKEHAIVPSVVAGYLTGEYAALCTAGGITFPDGLYYLSKYAALYNDVLHAKSYKALRITGLSKEQLQCACLHVSTGNEFATIAVYVGPHEHIVTGTLEALENLHDTIVQERTVSSEDTALEVGLHSWHMDSAVVNLKLYSEKIDTKELHTPLIASSDARVITHADEAKAMLLKHVHMPVLWSDSIDLCAQTCDVFVQVCPGSDLIDSVRERYPDKVCFAIGKPADIEALKKYLEIDSIPTPSEV